MSEKGELRDALTNGAGITYLHTFDFPIYIDISAPLSEFEFLYHEHRCVVYPPFRIAPANRLPAPPVNLSKIPWPRGVTVNVEIPDGFMMVAAHPTLGTDDKPGMNVVWGPDWPDEARYRPADSMRLDLFWNATRDEVEIEKSQKELAAAILVCLRALTRQSWIGKSFGPLNGSLRLTFSIGTRSEPLTLPVGTAQGRTFIGFERVVRPNVWNALRSVLVLGERPRLAEELLLDAQYNLAIGDSRRAVLDAALSCDTCKEYVFDKHVTGKEGKPVKRGRYLKGTDLADHLDHGAQTSFGRSLRQEKPAVFDHVETLWKLRHEAAHGFGRLLQGSREVDDKQIQTWLASAGECLDWLLSLVGEEAFWQRVK